MNVLPTVKQEEWRWSDLSGVAASLVQAAANDAAPDAAPWRVGEGPLWVFVDGVAVARHALGRDEERGGQPLTDDARGRGVALDLGAEHASSGLIEIVHFATGGAAHLAHRYALGADAQASVVETYVQLGDAPAWANVAVEIDLAQGARLMRHVRRFERAGAATETTRVRVGQGASYAGLTLLAGEASARAQTHASLDAAGAFASVDGVVLAGIAAKHDVVSVVTHAAPDTASRQTWRAVARGLGAASVSAKVAIARDAQRSNAEQSLRGLLMDRTATINAKPELEIFADDVKASHGCAVGELDAAALFYLAQRGVPPVRARALMTQAFLAQALGQAGDAAARAMFESDAFAWLEAGR